MAGPSNDSEGQCTLAGFRHLWIGFYFQIVPVRERAEARLGRIIENLSSGTAAPTVLPRVKSTINDVTIDRSIFIRIRYELCSESIQVRMILPLVKI